MDLFDWETFRATPLSQDPYEHVIVSGFVKAEALRKINADYPEIQDTGSFAIEGLKFGPGFKLMRVAQFNGVTNKRNHRIVSLRHRLSASVKHLLRGAKP